MKINKTWWIIIIVIIALITLIGALYKGGLK